MPDQANRFIAGSVVTVGDMFFGRKDIFDSSAKRSSVASRLRWGRGLLQACIRLRSVRVPTR